MKLFVISSLLVADFRSFLSSLERTIDLLHDDGMLGRIRKPPPRQPAPTNPDCAWSVHSHPVDRGTCYARFWHVFYETKIFLTGPRECLRCFLVRFLLNNDLSPRREGFGGYELGVSGTSSIDRATRTTDTNSVRALVCLCLCVGAIVVETFSLLSRELSSYL